MIKTKNIIMIILMFIAIIMISTTSYASDVDNMITDADNFITTGTNAGLPINETALQTTSSTIYNILFSIAVIVAIGGGMIIGIQFITGSVEEQAKVKETLIPYIVGVIVIFGAFTIWRIVVNIIQNI